MHDGAAFGSLPWDDVRLLLALLRAPTLAQAAKSLALDPSTLSRRLTAMESILATTLFDRGREGIAPTASAENLLPLAEEMEGVMLRFQRAAEGFERETSGLVRIACPPDVAEVLIAPMLGELFARHPALRVEVQAGEAVVDLTRREADLALRTVRPSSGDLLITRLASARWILAGSPALVNRLGVIRSWGDVPWISWGGRLAHMGAARWLTEHARSVEPVVRSDSLLVQLGMVRRSVGVALVPSPSVPHYGLLPVKIGRALRKGSQEWPTDELFLVTHRALRDVPRVRVVWDLLLQLWGERPR